MPRLAAPAARAGAREISVPAELDALRRARAVLRRARQGLLQGRRPRRRNPGRQRLDHGRAARRQPTNPVAYVDAATMMRGIGAGMPIRAVGVTLQQSPMSFIYRADAARPTKIEEIKGSRIAMTAGDASLAIFTAFMGKLGMTVERREADHRRQSAVEGAGRAQQAGRCAARLLHGPGPAHAAADRREDGLDAAHRHVRHLDLEQRDHRQQRLGRRKPRTRICCAASCAPRSAAGNTPSTTATRRPRSS